MLQIILFFTFSPPIANLSSSGTGSKREAGFGPRIRMLFYLKEGGRRALEE
jgi:hypothetical protein